MSLSSSQLETSAVKLHSTHFWFLWSYSHLNKSRPNVKNPFPLKVRQTNKTSAEDLSWWDALLKSFNSLICFLLCFAPPVHPILFYHCTVVMFNTFCCTQRSNEPFLWASRELSTLSLLSCHSPFLSRCWLHTLAAYCKPERHGDVPPCRLCHRSWCLHRRLCQPLPYSPVLPLHRLTLQ